MSILLAQFKKSSLEQSSSAALLRSSGKQRRHTPASENRFSLGEHSATKQSENAVVSNLGNRSNVSISLYSLMTILIAWHFRVTVRSGLVEKSNRKQDTKKTEKRWHEDVGESPLKKIKEDKWKRKQV